MSVTDTTGNVQQQNGRLVFPENFVWGCGTSPTQVEGETVNEWKNYSARDKTKPDDGPNHWRKYRYDFKCLGDMNQRAYRLGFDWGRLQPAPFADFDRDVSFKYMEMLAELRSLGIEPYLTLFHFACPVWMAEKEGWLNPESPEWFADFAEKLAVLTDGEVCYWITHNEPAVYAFMAYVMQEFPPMRRGKFGQALKVLHNMQRGHALAYERIKKHQPGAQIGITKHFKRFLPFRAWHPVDQLSACLARTLFDRYGLAKFVTYQGRKVSDFVGVNYYGRMRMKGFNGISPITGFKPEVLEQFGVKCDDMWEQDPEYLCDCLHDVAKRTGLPIYVSENGVATEDEALREKYLREHLAHCHAAIQRGIDVRGFFYWSLMDNYEWGEGLTKRFGLLDVDFTNKNRRRELRRTARIYGKICASNVLSFSGNGEE
ncbi:MAG: family 1 glycosylhydrolase [Planctomycetes bacterium]|nr:family 1 glycosylhydrolase [Planctomycetota bacterium]